MSAALLVALGACAGDAPGERADGRVEETVAPATAPNPAVAADSPVAVVDDAGDTLRLPHAARRIVSLLPAATETLFALGAGDRVVARTDYDTGPAVRHLPSVGGGLDPSLEALVALRPELVVAFETAGGSPLREPLERLGIPVFGIAPQDTADVFANIHRLGRLTARDAAADSLAHYLRATFDSVRVYVAGRPRPTVLYVVGAEPLMTAGPNTFITQMIEVAGGKTVFPDLRTDWPQVSLEEVVRRQPEVVIWPYEVTDDPRERTERMLTVLNSPGWQALDAVRCGRVYTVPSELLHRPGPGMGDAARALRDAFHRSFSSGCRP